MIQINQNLDSVFYSIYRPIMFMGKDTSADTAFLRAELFVEKTTWSGTYVSTDIIINGYEVYSDNYRFNVMEHCRPFVGEGFCPIYSTLYGTAPGDIDTRRFRLDVWAVKYAPGDYGQLYDDLTDIVTTKSFTAISTITTDEYSLSYIDDYTVVDRLVLGYNKPSNFPDSHQPITNAPNREYAVAISSANIGPNDHQTININDFPCDSIYQPVSWTKTHTHLTMIMFIRNKSTQNWAVRYLPIVSNLTNGGELVRIPLHPATLEFLYVTATGVALNKLIDGSGNLISDLFFILPILSDIGGGNRLYWTQTGSSTLPRYRGYALTDDVNNGHCQHKKFVFINMKGGYDWFNCYGTNSKSVNVSGETYENHVTSAWRGLHVKQKLWNKREDTYKVITQPLTTEKAKWLEELVSSPKVWVQEKMKDNEMVWGGNNYLRPIIINDSDFQIHTTEDNVHYIEFSYTLSNPISIQRG